MRRIGKMSLKDKIDKFHDEGYEVEIQHVREGGYMPNDFANTGEMPVNWRRNPNPKGGKTVARLKKGYVEITGTALCSEKDNYNKQTGALIALGRVEEFLK